MRCETAAREILADLFGGRPSFVFSSTPRTGEDPSNVIKRKRGVTFFGKLVTYVAMLEI